MYLVDGQSFVQNDARPLSRLNELALEGHIEQANTMDHGNRMRFHHDPAAQGQSEKETQVYWMWAQGYRRRVLLYGLSRFRELMTPRDGVTLKQKRYERDRIYRARRKEKIKAYTKEYKKKNRQKIKARGKVNKAIARGKLLRLPCIRCGNLISQAHHEDYFKPLEVIWLCPKHHSEIHRNTSAS